MKNIADSDLRPSIIKDCLYSKFIFVKPEIRVSYKKEIDGEIDLIVTHKISIQRESSTYPGLPISVPETCLLNPEKEDIEKLEGSLVNVLNGKPIAFIRWKFDKENNFGFLQNSTDLGIFSRSIFNTYTCQACAGRGENVCGSCHGSKTQSCSSCYGTMSISCSRCSGSGSTFSAGRYESCMSCRGMRTERCYRCNFGRTDCSSCNGRGVRNCSACAASGSIYVKTYFIAKTEITNSLMITSEVKSIAPKFSLLGQKDLFINEQKFLQNSNGIDWKISENKNAKVILEKKISFLFEIFNIEFVGYDKNFNAYSIRKINSLACDSSIDSFVEATERGDAFKFLMDIPTKIFSLDKNFLSKFDVFLGSVPGKILSDNFSELTKKQKNGSNLNIQYLDGAKLIKKRLKQHANVEFIFYSILILLVLLSLSYAQKLWGWYFYPTSIYFWDSGINWVFCIFSNIFLMNFLGISKIKKYNNLSGLLRAIYRPNVFLLAAAISLYGLFMTKSIHTF